MADFATESGHWYRPNGEPAYTVIGKNGKERPATVRDARELGLFPSVTAIIRCAAAPGLENWKLNQLALAMATLPKTEGETWDAFIARARKDSEEQARKARERGSGIHGAIEGHFRGHAPDDDGWPFVRGALATIGDWCGPQEWLPEKSFAHSAGYGGKVDLHSSDWVIDFKTKEYAKAEPPKLWDEHFLQLAAYRRGLSVPEARCGIVFVSTAEPGLTTMFEASEEELQRGLAMFDALLAYWWSKNASNGYRRAA